MSGKKYPIDEKATVRRDGAEMSVRIRGTDPENPVLLFIHGGPGVCDRHWVLKYQSELAKVCTMVCWDQRGAGKSYNAKRAKTEKLTLDMMIEDAHAVVLYLKQRFNKPQIYILGHSWGTVLGVLLAQRYGGDIAMYAGMGQFANGADNEEQSYEFTVRRAVETGDKKAAAQLKQIGAPVGGHYKTFDDFMLQRNLMTKFGGGTYNKKEDMITSLVLPLLASPEYSLFDLPKYSNGAFYCLKQLWDEVVSLDFITSVKKLDMPVVILQGRHDYNTPTEISLRWYNALEAPQKTWVWFENSAHSPIKEEPELFGKAVAKQLFGKGL